MGKILYTKYHGGAYGAQVTPSAMYQGRESMRKALYRAETRMLLALRCDLPNDCDILRVLGLAQRTAQHISKYAEESYMAICRGLFQ